MMGSLLARCKVRMSIRISRYHINAFEEAARDAYPIECCGLVIGRKDDAFGFIIDELAPTKNKAAEVDRFEIDPTIHIRLQRDLRRGPNGIIGVYHSHPGGIAKPSDRDVAGAVMPGWVWLICGLRLGTSIQSRAFHDDGADETCSRFRELELFIHEDERLAS